jgi:hypothetical protein
MKQASDMDNLIITEWIFWGWGGAGDESQGLIHAKRFLHYWATPSMQAPGLHCLAFALYSEKWTEGRW